MSNTKPRLRVHAGSPVVETVAISSLHLRADNPRKHTPKQVRQIAESINNFGFRVPVLVDRESRIICGHGRVAACKKLGWEVIPVIRADDLDDNQVRALMIADNRLNELSDWDVDILNDHFELLLDADLTFDLEITGFDYGQIESWVSPVTLEEEQAEGADALPESEEVQQQTRPGDLWHLGDHRILCGDSTEQSSYIDLLGDSRAAIVFTDPPYNLKPKAVGQVCAKEHGVFAQGSGEMTALEFTAFLSGVFETLCKFSVDGSIHYICMDWRHLREIQDAGLANYSALKNLCVWVKDRAGMGSFYRSQHELVFVFKHGDEPHQNNFQLGQHGRNRSNVWRHPSAAGFNADEGDPNPADALSLHPTIKPVALIEEALLDCSRRGEVVLDPFLGSGSTLIAAERTGRRCFGIEQSSRYVDVAITRWEQWTGQKATHGLTGNPYGSRDYSLESDDE